MATKKKKSPKIGAIKLSDHELEVLARGVDTEFFNIITKKIIPQREVQVALTLLHAGVEEKDLYFYKGMLHVLDWFPEFVAKQVDKMDIATYANDDEDVDARDDNSSR